VPYDEAHADDPLELVGVPVATDLEAVREMAYTIAEEFAVLGWGEERLLKLFRTPFYSGPHRAWQLLGETQIERIVGESVAAYGGVRFVERDPQRRPERLPVLSRRTVLRPCQEPLPPVAGGRPPGGHRTGKED